MSFFQKILTTVNSIVAINIKGFEVEKDSFGNAGAQGLWRLHNATKGEKNKTKGTAFIFQKERLKESEKEEICALLKKEATSLARLRHPAILSLQESLQDEKAYMGFITEKVECSLANALTKPDLFQQHCGSEIEMKMHILELIEAVQFLHNDVRTVHLDINPNCIFITADGKWKLASLGFSQQIVNQNDLVDAQNVNFYSRKAQSPVLSYAAPELLNSSPKCTYASDIFSLGMFLLKLQKQRQDKISFPEFQSVDDYKQYLSRLISELSKNQQLFTPSLFQLITKMIDSNPNNRPSVKDIQLCDWFKDPFLQTFNLMNKITQMDQNQQIAFLKGLQQVILKFENPLLKKRILPNLLELTRYDYMIPYVLKIIIDVMRREDIMDKQLFQTQYWPKIKSLTQAKEIPAQALYDLVCNIKLFYTLTTLEEIQQNFVPLMTKCFECKVPKLQDIAIRVTPFIVKHSDYTFTKNKILPRITSLCVDSNVEVRRVALICLYNFLDTIDRSFLCDQVLQTLEKIKAAGTDGQMNLIILKVYQKISKTLSVEHIATKILPQITPFLIDHQITKLEFDDYMDTLKQLLEKIQEERYKTFDHSQKEVGPPLNLELEIPQPNKQQQQPQIQNSFDFLSLFDQPAPTQNSSNQQTPPPPLTQSQQNHNPISDPFGLGGFGQTQGYTQPAQTTSPQIYQPTSVQQAQKFQPSNFQTQPQSFQTQPQNIQAQPQIFQQQPQSFQTQPIAPKINNPVFNPVVASQQNHQNINDPFAGFNLNNNESAQPYTFQQNTQQPPTTQQFNFDSLYPQQQVTQQINNDQGARKLRERPLFNSGNTPQMQKQNSGNSQKSTQPNLPNQQQAFNNFNPPQPKQLNVNYDPFKDLNSQQNSQDIWNQVLPTTNQTNQSKNKYDAFDLI